jgi:hypothetical protein
VGELIIKLTYNFKELEKESELHFYGFKNVKGKMKPLIVRGGMPQGLSMSPLLSTLAMEFIPPHPGLCMYADDGLFFSDDPEEFYFFMDSLGGYGISVAEDKTKLVDKTKDIKFLGCNINFEKEYIEYEGKSIKFSDKNLEKFLKTVSSQYCKKKYR